MEYACEQQKYARAQGLSFDVMARCTHVCFGDSWSAGGWEGLQGARPWALIRDDNTSSVQAGAPAAVTKMSGSLWGLCQDLCPQSPSLPCVYEY